MRLKFTEEEHNEMAEIARRIEDDLRQLSNKVAKANYSDNCLQAGKFIQHKLFDPLIESWELLESKAPNPYPNTLYRYVKSLKAK